MNKEKNNGEKLLEIRNEIMDGQRETWINDNLNDLKEDFMKETFDEKSEEFKEYCEERWKDE